MVQLCQPNKMWRLNKPFLSNIFYSIKVLLPENILTDKLQFTNVILYTSTSSQQIKDHKRSTKKSPRVLVVSTGERDGV